MKPVRITATLLREWPLPPIAKGPGKVARGRVVALVGSSRLAGVAVLVANAALRAGAGTVRIATTRDAMTTVAVAVPEALVIGLPATRGGEIAAAGVRAVLPLLDRCDTLLVGPGMRDAAASRRLLAALRRRESRPVVVADAGALLDPPRGPNTVLTPHPGEAAKLLDVAVAALQRDPVAAATRLARRYDCVVALKGVRTIVVDPSGRAFDNVAGNVGLGTSGSGDVLAGVIAGLCARGAQPLQAAVWGVHAHAKAGERLARRIGVVGYLARELAAEIPALLTAWSRG